MAGHGPGVNVLLSGAAGKLRPILDPTRANIADLLKLRA